MGAIASSIYNRFNKPKSVMLVGPEGAGKTTLLFKLISENTENIPVVGFAVETVQYRNFQFTAFELGGGQKIKNLLRLFYESCDAVVFVFDSQDKDQERWEFAAKELHELSSQLAENRPILIFANKQDLGNAMSLEEITKILHPHNLKQKNWHIEPCSAIKGDGLHEGIDWMDNFFKNK